MATAHSDPIWLQWASRPLRSFVLTGIAALVLIVLSLVLNGTAAVGWHAATRSTAIFTFGIWLLTFIAAPLARLLPNSSTRALLARRRGVGLAFAAALGVHGLAILRLATLESEILTLDLGGLGGGLGFVFAIAMAATSNDAAVARMGRARWRRLHQAGQFAFVIIFAVAYGGRVVGDPSYWPAVALLLAALGLRGIVFAQSVRLRSKTLPTE